MTACQPLTARTDRSVPNFVYLNFKTPSGTYLPRVKNNNNNNVDTFLAVVAPAAERAPRVTVQLFDADIVAGVALLSVPAIRTVAMERRVTSVHDFVQLDHGTCAAVETVLRRAQTCRPTATSVSHRYHRRIIITTIIIIIIVIYLPNNTTVCTPTPV